ncbi:ThiF family adenylyltransferase, partial [uncultured Muribaculum sp.]
MPVNEFNQRTALLLGNEAVELLATRRITVVGTGGVGSYAVEMLARAGVGHITIVDADVVAPSNLNRQLPALHSTIGAPKVEVMKRRIHDINP